MVTIQFTWSTHRTREAAENEIESAYADGQFSPCDNPTIVKNRNGRFDVVINDNLLNEYYR